MSGAAVANFRRLEAGPSPTTVTSPAVLRGRQAGVAASPLLL